MDLHSNEHIFRHIFQQYYAELLIYVRGLVGRADAEDIVADVFTELWDTRHNKNWGEHIRAFLYKAALSRSLNHLRHRHVSQRHCEVLRRLNEQALSVDEYAAVEQDEENGMRLQRVNQVMESLPDKCRQVVRLFYVYGMSSREVSDTLGISVRTVEAHLYRGLRMLRERL